MYSNYWYTVDALDRNARFVGLYDGDADIISVCYTTDTLEVAR